MSASEKKYSSLPLVVLFGRTNVGKSTLFNCLTEKHQALVSAIAGTTRDSNIGPVGWRNSRFNVIDTGGIIDLKRLAGPDKAGAGIDDKIGRQARQYLKAADLIIFLVDGKAGLLPQDSQLALFLKKGGQSRKTILAINKVDSPKDRLNISEFYKLSLGEPRPLSAANGSGTGDLLDVIVEKLTTHNAQRITHNKNANNEEGLRDTDRELRVCIIGKPNVGKSSLLNSLLGYERVIVSPAPHTTREPQHTDIVYRERIIRLIDTAGISRRGQKTYGLEKLGVAKSLSALAESDLALLVLDIGQNITHQDAALVEKIIEAKKSFIIIANKWDKVAARNTKKYSDYIYGKLPFARFAPLQFASALSGEKINKIFDLILTVGDQRKLKLSDSQLSHFLSRVVKIHRPAKAKGLRHPRVRGLSQKRINPPLFEIKIGAKEDLHFSYIRFLENRLRETYSFLGTPLTIIVTKIYGHHYRPGQPRPTIQTHSP